MFRADKDDLISLKNWMHDFDLVCVNSFMIGLFGMLNFTGMVLGTFWTPQFLDKYG